MNRFLFLLLPTFAVSGGFAHADPINAPTTQALQRIYENARTPGNAPGKLRMKLPEIRFNANRLNEVIDFVRDVTDTNIWVDFASMDAVQAPSDVRQTPITMHEKMIQLSDVLDSIAKQTNTSAARMKWMNDDETIYIASPSRIESVMALRARVTKAAKNPAQREMFSRRLLVENVDIPGDMAPTRQLRIVDMPFEEAIQKIAKDLDVKIALDMDSFGVVELRKPITIGVFNPTLDTLIVLSTTAVADPDRVIVSIGDDNVTRISLKP